MSEEEILAEGCVTPTSALVYFQAPRVLGPGLDSFTSSGFPATPFLQVSRNREEIASSPLSLEADCDRPFPSTLSEMPPSSEMGGSKLVLLVGCGGFIGSHVAVKLLSAGYSVRIFLLDTCSNEQLEALQVHARGSSKLFVFRGDQLDRAFDDCEFVVIAQLPRRPGKYSRRQLSLSSEQDKVLEECTKELRDLFLCAKKYGKRLKRIVHISSAAAVFPVVEPVRADTLGSVAQRKLLKEVEKLAAKADIPLVSLLPSVVLGPAWSSHELSDNHYHLLNLATTWLPWVPKLRYNVVSIADVVEAAVAVLEHPAAEGQRYLLSCKEMSVQEIHGVLSSGRCSSSRQKREMPNGLSLVLGVCGLLGAFTPAAGAEAFRFFQRNLDRRFLLSSAKCVRDLGLRCSTDVHQSIVESVQSAQAAPVVSWHRRMSDTTSIFLESVYSSDGFQEKKGKFSEGNNSTLRSKAWTIGVIAGILVSTAAVLSASRRLLGSCTAALANATGKRSLFSS